MDPRWVRGVGGVGCGAGPQLGLWGGDDDGCGMWAGNAALHALTGSGPTELRVDLRTPSDSAFARYRDFAVGGPEDSFRLHLGAYSGTAGACGAGGVLEGSCRV